MTIAECDLAGQAICPNKLILRNLLVLVHRRSKVGGCILRAAVLEELGKPLVVRDVREPAVESHGAIVRVEANGICRTDWHGWVGDWDWIGWKLPLPWVMGHEFCGIVEELGREVGNFRIGDRVVVPQGQGEGKCEQCLTGHHNICDAGIFAGFSYWGGFGRYVSVPHADINLVRMPESLGFVEAAGLGCRFGTSFHGLVNRVQVRAGEWIAIHGCGGIGLSAVHIASALGANVIAVDIDEIKLAAARDLGAAATVLARGPDPAGEIRELTKGGAHVAVDGLGIAETCQNAIRSLRKRGRHLQLGMTGSAERGEIALPIDRIVGDEIDVFGSGSLPGPSYGAMLRMIETGKLEPRKLVSRTVALEEVSDVLAAMSSYQTVGFTVIDRF
jgi:D-arabinose 1-dehydrogenase-like Zn-dependent alcohol dehydrogenase